MPKMRSLRGAAIDVILIQQRTKIHATSVLSNYLESMGHMNPTEDTEGSNVSIAQCALHLACWLFACGDPCRGVGVIVCD